MKNKARVHMLPTEKSDILIDTIDGNIYYTPLFNQEKTVNVKPQHLYITTDEEIKEGDYFLLEGQNEKGVWEVFRNDGEEGLLGGWERKIIATTDPKLTSKTTRLEKITNPGVYEKPLPQIPRSFIEEYCKAGGIDKVLVEYDVSGYMHGNLRVGIPPNDIEIPNTAGDKRVFYPKLDSNNCIIIHPAKLTGEDVIAKMGWDWYETESSARRVAEFCANNLIHPVEEKMYTLKQMKHMFDIGRDSAFQEMHFDEAIKYRDNELNKMD